MSALDVHDDLYDRQEARGEEQADDPDVFDTEYWAFDPCS